MGFIEKKESYSGSHFENIEKIALFMNRAIFSMLSV